MSGINGYTGTFEMVDPRTLVVDHNYQRGKKETLVAQISADPRWEAFGVPVCFKRRNGALYVADGQQRIQGVMKSQTPPRQVPIVWFPAPNVETEAEIFTYINEWRKALLPLEKHRAKVISKDPAALAVERALEKVGYTFASYQADHSRHPRNIQAIAGVGVIYNRIGEEGLIQTLTVIRDAWPEDATALSTHILRGVANLIEEQGDEYHRGRLTAALQKTSPAQVLRQADALRYDLGGSKLLNVRRAFKKLAKV